MYFASAITASCSFWNASYEAVSCPLFADVIGIRAPFASFAASVALTPSMSPANFKKSAPPSLLVPFAATHQPSIGASIVSRPCSGLISGNGMIERSA